MNQFDFQKVQDRYAKHLSNMSTAVNNFLTIPENNKC